MILTIVLIKATKLFVCIRALIPRSQAQVADYTKEWPVPFEAPLSSFGRRLGRRRCVEPEIPYRDLLMRYAIEFIACLQYKLIYKTSLANLKFIGSTSYLHTEKQSW